MSTIYFIFPDPSSYDLSGTSEEPRSMTWRMQWQSVKDILANYVQPDSTLPLSDAVDQVAQYWNRTRADYKKPLLLVPQALAEQIPYDHPSHKKLAEFMLALYDSEKYVAATDPEARSKEKHLFWLEFCCNLEENDWRPEETANDIEDGDDPIQFANVSAFIANLVFPERYPTKFLYSLAREALDDIKTLKPTFLPGVPEARVIGAAQYITYQSPVIFDEVIKSCKSDAELQKSTHWYTPLFHRGCRYTGPKPWLTFFWHEWDSWKMAFRTVAVDQRYSSKCREYAQRAADVMALQEKLDDDRCETTKEGAGPSGRLTELEQQQLHNPRFFKKKLWHGRYP